MPFPQSSDRESERRLPTWERWGDTNALEEGGEAGASDILPTSPEHTCSWLSTSCSLGRAGTLSKYGPRGRDGEDTLPTFIFVERSVTCGRSRHTFVPQFPYL